MEEEEEGFLCSPHIHAHKARSKAGSQSQPGEARQGSKVRLEAKSGKRKGTAVDIFLSTLPSLPLPLSLSASIIKGEQGGGDSKIFLN